MVKVRRLVLGGLVAAAVVVAGLVVQSSRSTHEPIVLDQQAFLQAHLETLAPREPSHQVSRETLHSLRAQGDQFEPRPVPADVGFDRDDVMAALAPGRKGPSEVVYGLFTTERRGTTVKVVDGSEKIVPRIDHRPVWIVMTRDVPMQSMGGPVTSGPPREPEVGYGYSWFAYSAKTGRPLLGASG